MDSRDQVASGVELIVIGSTLLAGSHTIVVIFANIDHRKFVETCNVGSLKELTLVSSTVTIHSARKCIFTFVFHGKRQTGTYW